MQMKEERMQLSTPLKVEEIISRLEQFSQKERKVEIEPIVAQPDAFGRVPERMDIEVLVTGQISTFHNRWAVQVYVKDAGEKRDVMLIALGNSTMAVIAGAYAATQGTANQLAFAPQYKDSVKMQKKIADAISF